MLCIHPHIISRMYRYIYIYICMHRERERENMFIYSTNSSAAVFILFSEPLSHGVVLATMTTTTTMTILYFHPALLGRFSTRSLKNKRRKTVFLRIMFLLKTSWTGDNIHKQLPGALSLWFELRAFNVASSAASAPHGLQNLYYIYYI